jgi:hypothetical protein
VNRRAGLLEQWSWTDSEKDPAKVVGWKFEGICQQTSMPAPDLSQNQF